MYRSTPNEIAQMGFPRRVCHGGRVVAETKVERLNCFASARRAFPNEIQNTVLEILSNSPIPQTGFEESAVYYSDSVNIDSPIGEATKNLTVLPDKETLRRLVRNQLED